MVNIDQSKCIGCGQCVDDCVAQNITLKDEKAACNEPCILCGHCVAICPTKAISIPEYEMSDVEEHDPDRFGFDISHLLHTIKMRRSTRHYIDQPVEQKKLELIIQAGRYTATGVNCQGCRFLMVKDDLDTLKDKIWNGIKDSVKKADVLPAQLISSYENFINMRKEGTDYLFRNAPIVLYIAAESTVDAALAAQNMELAAISQGLGVLYNGFLVYAASSNPDVCNWLDVQDKPIAVCMLIGYPEKTYKRTAPRREADVRWK